MSFLKEHQISHCFAGDRSLKGCGATYCSKKEVPNVHLYFFRAERTFASAKDIDFEKDKTSLRIFVDTCAVIAMMEKEKSVLSFDCLTRMSNKNQVDSSAV